MQGRFLAALGMTERMLTRVLNISASA